MSEAEKTEFEFDDLPEDENPRKGGRVVEPETNTTVEEKPEIEVVDDTPEEDRGRKPAPPPRDVTDDELSKYDESVRSRIKHFSKGYHDERRAKEAALREREALAAYAQQLASENARLQGTLGQNQQTLIAQTKRVVQEELANAKRKYKEAYEAGDADAVVAAQAELTQATIKADRLEKLRPAPVQTQRPVVQPPVQAAPPVQVDSKAAEWQTENTWFGQDAEMTSFALGLHTKMVQEGVDPTSDVYYTRLNKRLRQVFPDAFGGDVDANSQRRKSNVVAPATRSTAPKKIVLTQSQVNVAKRLGVPLELYARKVAEEMRKQ